MNNGNYPAPFVRDAGGKPMHSWGALIARYTDYRQLSRRYDFHGPWDSPHNRLVTASEDRFRTARVFSCRRVSLPEGRVSGAGEDHGLDLTTDSVTVTDGGVGQAEGVLA